MNEVEFDDASAPPGCFDRKFKIDAGDAFLLDGLTLLCAAVSEDGNRVYWNGWPHGSALMKECALVQEADRCTRRRFIVDWGHGHSARPDREGPDDRIAINRDRLGITARERAAADRKRRIDAVILLVQDARARNPGRTADLFRAARLLARPDEAAEALNGMIGEPPA